MASAPRRRRLNSFERTLESVARTPAGTWWFINIATRIDRRLLPLTRGRVSSAPGQPVGMLETVGARSGQPRRTPLLYVRDGDRVVLLASKGGDPRHPAWYWNLKRYPRVRFLGPAGLTGDYIAREAVGEERDRLWAEAIDLYDGFSTYAGRTGGRVIPVVVLERA